jgi:serine/threonine protein kinase
MKLGQGSFGVVYLVVKILVDPKTKQTKQTNKFYAMKVLNKK